MQNTSKLSRVQSPAPDATEAPRKAPAPFDPLAAIRAIRDADGQKTDKAVLFMLVSRCNRLGVCHPTVECLAHDVGTSKRDIYRAIWRLRYAKMVKVTSAPRQANIYQLRMEDLSNRVRWEALKLANYSQSIGEKLTPDAPPSNESHDAEEPEEDPFGEPDSDPLPW